MTTATSTRKSADEIASMFTERGGRKDSEGIVHFMLTAKQTGWLKGQADHESILQRGSRSARQASGLILVDDKSVGTWHLTVAPNGAGFLKVSYYQTADDLADEALEAYTELQNARMLRDKLAEHGMLTDLIDNQIAHIEKYGRIRN